MPLPINNAFPGYSDPTNYSGANSAVRSGGLAISAEHHETVLGLERSGRLGLTVFGLVQLPRDVLMLQDERSAKTKAPNVSSSTKTTSDDDRLLSQVDDGTQTVQSKEDGGGNGGSDGYHPPAKDGEAPASEAAAAHVKTTPYTEADAASFAAHNPSAPAREPVHTGPMPSLLGRGNAVYLGVISSSSHIAGRNVSLLT